jgi:hypothetical protein
VQQDNQWNLQPLGEDATQQGEQKLLSQQAEENQFHDGSKGNGVVISNRTKQLGEMSNTNVDEELNFMVDQLKEIALKVGNRNCVMIAQIANLQREKDVLAKQLEDIKSQLLN